MGDTAVAVASLHEEPCAQWRRLGTRLWAGRWGLSSLGTIEWGRRFVWVDPDGHVRGRYPSLLEAQDAAESVIDTSTRLPRSA